MDVTIPMALDRIARRSQRDGLDDPSKPDQVIDQAMSDLADHDQPSESIDVAALIAEAEASLALGEGRVWSPELRREIIERARTKIQQGLPPAPHVCP